GTVAIANFSARYMIDAAISAAEIRSQAKTISRPSIITQNNVEGMVQQGTQIPVQTTINNTISVQYVNATLQLTVTPQVTDDGHVFLKIMVQNASPGTIITGAAVSINIQQATTSVLVPDGYRSVRRGDGNATHELIHRDSPAWRHSASRASL